MKIMIIVRINVFLLDKYIVKYMQYFIFVHFFELNVFENINIINIQYTNVLIFANINVLMRKEYNDENNSIKIQLIVQTTLLTFINTYVCKHICIL